MYNNEDEKILESESITKRLNDQMESDKETLGNLTDESTTNVNRKITGATSISYDFIPDGSISDYLESGTYKCGSDFEPGEYYIYGFLGPSPSVRLSNAKDEGSWSGEDRALLKKMSFKDGDYFKMYSDLIMFPSDNIDSDKYNEFGIFIVGKDIMPGEYRVTNINDRYTGEFANASGEILGGIEIYENNTSIGENPIYSTNMFEKQYIVNLEIDQIVILVNAQLEQL